MSKEVTRRVENEGAVYNAQLAETRLDQIAQLLDQDRADPTPELQRAVGRAEQAARELWHKIGHMQAEQYREAREGGEG